MHGERTCDTATLSKHNPLKVYVVSVIVTTPSHLNGV